jgi:hypothetical protein
MPLLNMAKRLFHGSHKAEFGSRFSLCELVHRRDWRGSHAPYMSGTNWYSMYTAASNGYADIVIVPQERKFLDK